MECVARSLLQELQCPTERGVNTVIQGHVAAVHLPSLGQLMSAACSCCSMNLVPGRNARGWGRVQQWLLAALLLGVHAISTVRWIQKLPFPWMGYNQTCSHLPTSVTKRPQNGMQSSCTSFSTSKSICIYKARSADDDSSPRYAPAFPPFFSSNLSGENQPPFSMHIYFSMSIIVDYALEKGSVRSAWTQCRCSSSFSFSLSAHVTARASPGLMLINTVTAALCGACAGTSTSRQSFGAPPTPYDLCLYG